VTERANLFTADGLETVTIVSPDADLQATFIPAAGMVCGSLQHLGEELLAQRNGVRAYAERGSTMGIPLLHPWANRLAGFEYTVATRVVKLDEDSPLIARDARGLPIHGVIPGRLSWEPIDRDAAESANRLRARMRWDRPELLAIFPFPHALELDARMAGSTLTIGTTLRPSADVAVPVSFGYHPYLTVPGTGRSGWHVELPVNRRLLLDERMIPTGASEPFRTPRFELGESGWDDAFTGVTQPPRFVASAAGRRIELEFLEGYPYAQVFAPAGESFICFEPMTAPTNALLSGADLPLVGPGEVFRAAFRVSIAGARE
jgi:aldose 1-epimerase